jgi:transposase-like protein
VDVEHSTLNRWTLQESPLREEACHRRQRSVGGRERMDETASQVQGQGRALERAVDQTGQTLDVLLTQERDEHAAKRFLTKALRRHGVPETIPMEGSAAHAAAITSSHEEHGTAIALRKMPSLNHMVEQDQRGVTRVTRPRLGCQSCEAAQGTLVGIALMPRIKKKQLVVKAGDEGLTAAELFYSLVA